MSLKEDVKVIDLPKTVKKAVSATLPFPEGSLYHALILGNLNAYSMSASLPNFAERVNLFLYRQNIRRLGASDIGLARDWSLALIRKEHPHLTEEEVERFYENLIHVRIIAVDEWTRRMT